VIASNIQEIVESANLKRSKEALTVMNTVEKILKNLGVKCNFANNMVFRPGEFQALSTGDIDFLKLRTVGDSGDLRDKYVEITANLLLGDAGKLSFNFLSALDFSILLQGRTRACAVFS
jgi:hypothetical protein